MKTRAVLLSVLLTSAATAGPRTSANYSIITDTADSGGTRTTSANYTNDGSVGGVTGVSSVVLPIEIAKHGYIGQLYDLASGIYLSAAPATINEGDTKQIAAVRLLDDGTGLALDPTTVIWSVLGGPITSISTGGVAIAGIVYQDTAASVQGVASGFTASLSLSVLNTIPDNYGSYAGDGIDDAWQVQYFGLNNPLAAPNVVTDGSGHTNLFKYTAGLVPFDSNSRLVLSIAPVPGQPAQKSIIFSPLVLTGGRTYTVTYCTDLTTGTWQPLTTTTQADNGNQRTVTDTSATGAKKFYRIEITKP